MAGRNQSLPAGVLQAIDHFLGQVLVFANQNVHMVRHNGARVASVFLLFDNARECAANFPARGLIEAE